MLDWTVLCLIAIPALVVVAVAGVAILCEDGRPVFFRQVRIGLRGRPFRMLKLRTMSTCAAPESEVPDAAWITRVGRILRRLSVDELPQLINVARGEMSLVGPRPHLPERAQGYGSRELGRLAVLPGLTGWAQTVGRNSLDWDRRTDHDLMYSVTQSLRLDLLILLRSCWVVVSGDGLNGHPRHAKASARMRRGDALHEHRPRQADRARLEPTNLQ
ncbi:sugar transferase [Glycomyces buryatensis]|uniref:sugar transferase n=1 Tax=Glycomyces buryatensis TaxID=2570927 RepID=UPI0014562F25|nr:sugar transferase [Glycomyces buryatensis]